jgi:hypothetical protein
MRYRDLKTGVAEYDAGYASRYDDVPFKPEASLKWKNGWQDADYIIEERRLGTDPDQFVINMPIRQWSAFTRFLQTIQPDYFEKIARNRDDAFIMNEAYMCVRELLESADYPC